MRNEWKTREIELGIHKSGTHIIRGIDDIVALLDDQLMKAQSMCASPYIKPIESDAKSWEQHLRYSQTTLEAWIQCQRTWAYLEPVFSSEDILRQLPTEARR